MTKLSGYEASVLAFIAMFPDSKAAEEKASSLEGEARDVADVLLGHESAAERHVEASETADAIRAWANDAANQARQA